jgi:hypothetical protein
MNKKTLIIVAIVGIAVAVLAFSSSYGKSGSGKKWTQPKFVKEWEIKDIQGLRPNIISTTATKKGIYVLVSIRKTDTLQPKRISEMTKGEISREKTFYGKNLTDEERLKKPGRNIEEFWYYVQQYNYEGAFIKQWPDNNKVQLTDELRSKTKKIGVSVYNERSSEMDDIDSRDCLVEPLKITADDSGNLYLADYTGNKVVKFGPNGDVLNVWWIKAPNTEYTIYNDLSGCSGICVAGNKLYLISNGYKEDYVGYLPNLAIYDLNGRLLESRLLPSPRVPLFNNELLGGAAAPILKQDGQVHEVRVDSQGNIYLLAGDGDKYWLVEVYDKNYKKLKKFEPVIKEGLDTGIMVYNPKTKQNEKYKKFVVFPKTLGFNSHDSCGTLTDVRLYPISNLYLSPDEEIVVTYAGQKPFGTINALIYNKDGRKLGYWKDTTKSYSDWFKNLTEYGKHKSFDLSFEMAFQGDRMVVGRTIAYDDSPTPETTMFGSQSVGVRHPIIQIFER